MTNACHLRGCKPPPNSNSRSPLGRETLRLEQRLPDGLSRVSSRVPILPHRPHTHSNTGKTQWPRAEAVSGKRCPLSTVPLAGEASGGSAWLGVGEEEKVQGAECPGPFGPPPRVPAQPPAKGTKPMTLVFTHSLEKASHYKSRKTSQVISSRLISR